MLLGSVGSGHTIVYIYTSSVSRSSNTELHSSNCNMSSQKRQKLDVDFMQIAENLTADEAMVWNRLIVNQESGEQESSRKQRHDGHVSIDYLSDEIMLLILNFMFGFEFDASKNVFDTKSSVLRYDSKTTMSRTDQSFPKTVKISHVNIMKKLEPLRLVCKAWNTQINMFYNYRPWTLSFTSQDNIILPLVLLHQPQIKSLHIEPATAAEMCLQLYFLHVYDLRQMETLLIDRTMYQEIYSQKQEEDAVLKRANCIQERVMKTPFGQSFKYFLSSRGIIDTTKFEYLEFIKGVVKILAQRGVALRNFHLDVAGYDCLPIFKLKPWNVLKQRIQHLSLTNNMNYIRSHKARVMSLQKAIKGMPALESLVIDCVTGFLDISSSSVKTLRVNTFHEKMSRSDFSMDLTINCENLESLYAFVEIHKFESFFKNTRCSPNIHSFFLNIKHDRIPRHMWWNKYVAMSQMINEMPSLKHLVLRRCEIDKTSEQDFFDLRFDDTNEVILDIHSDSIQSIEAIDADPVLSRCVCPNLKELKVKMKANFFPDIVSNPQLRTLVLKTGCWSTLLELFDKIFEVMKMCHRLESLDVIITRLGHERSSVVIDILRSYFEEIDPKDLRGRRYSVRKELADDGESGHFYNFDSDDDFKLCIRLDCDTL